MNPLRERLMIAGLRRRDEGAFVECVRQYQDKVFNLVYRMLGSREEAEEISQEVFVTVFKSIESFRGDAKFSTWLYRVAINHSKNRIKYLRRRAQRATSELDTAAEREILDAQPHSMTPHVAAPDQVLEGMQLERIVQEGIALLDEEHRMLVVLRDVEELSYEEIGQISGLAEGTVKSRLHRARMALKDHIAKHMK